MLLTACSQSEIDRFLETVLMVFLAMLLVSIVAMIITALYMLFSIYIVVMNVVRPSRFTMVTGFVIGGLDLLTLMGSAGIFFSFIASAEGVGVEGELLPLVAWSLVSAIIGGVKIASSVYAKGKLYPAAGMLSEEAE